MDTSQYPPNGINTTGSSYPSPSAISPHQLQHNGPQTLPPLQPHPSTMQSMYGSHPQTPRTPATPNTPGANTMSNYPPPPTQSAGRGNAYSMSAYGHNAYGTSSAMLPQTTLAPSHQPIAPAPSSGRVPPVLRPMPAGGVIPQPGVSSPYGAQPHMNQSMPDTDAPTHVVGSQGRRGILPSAPGRPTAPIAGTGSAKNSQIPQKNEEGKFPCPHCTKTYLHAKHLKRHLLRRKSDVFETVIS
jgi:hypothetical protein